MKHRILYIIMILSLGAYFAGQILTADAGGVSSSSFSEILQVDDCASLHGADSDECANDLVVVDQSEERVPTAIKLVYTGTEIRDPVSTAGIVFIFFVLLALSGLWMSMIRNWNRTAPE